MEHKNNVNTATTVTNPDVFAGSWKQMRGSLRQWWGKLTDNDVEQIAGQKDKLVGMLQEKYGYTRDYAQNEIERRMQEYRGRMGGVGEAVTTAAHDLSERTRNTAKALGETTQEVGHKIGAQADYVRTSVGDSMESLAETIRETSPREGTVASAADSVAEGIETAADYVRESDFGKMSEDVATLVRRYPLQSMLVGIGIGYLMASRGR